MVFGMNKLQTTVLTIFGSIIVFCIVFFDVLFFGEDLIAPWMKSFFGW